MQKVILNKSTKIKSKGFVLAGVEIEVTADEKKLLDKGGFLDEIKKDNSPNSDKEISALVAKVSKLEAELKDSESGDTSKLKDEIKTLKSENDDLRKELVNLAGDKEEHKGLLEKWGFKK